MTSLNVQTTPVCCFGEILWDILPDGPQPGGAPLNVAYHLTKLNVSTNLISRIGKDPEGKQLEDLMDNWRIGKHLLQSDPVHDTGRVIAKINSGGDMNYEIMFPVAWDFIEVSTTAIAKVKESEYFIYGSLAARNVTSRNTLFQLLDYAKFKVFDINLRPPFFEKQLLESMLKKADLLKVNESEIGEVLGMWKCDLIDENAQVNFIKKKFNIGEVLITKGANGASYYTSNSVYHAAGNSTEVCDTVGCGDSFLAAFISGHFLKESPDMILKKAVVMGSLIAGKKGGCPEYLLSEYHDLFGKYSSDLDIAK